ncbi:MAG TPA: diguanylate cyclase [Massilibacterium sp.]|nr:diguanylate cyclase [Massilibacterium sp.]
MKNELHSTIKSENTFETFKIINQLHESFFSVSNQFYKEEVSEGLLQDSFSNIDQALQKYMQITSMTLFIYNKWNQNYDLYYETDFLKNKSDHQSTSVKEEIVNKIMQLLLNKEVIYNASLNQDNFYTMIKLTNEKKMIGLLLLSFKEQWSDEKVMLFQAISLPLKQTLYYILKEQLVADENKRHHLLFSISKKVFTKMEMEDVLEEVIYALKEIYPTFEYLLLLTYEQTKEIDVPIKYLTFLNDKISPLTEKVYLTGEIQMVYDETKRKCLLYVPLKGRQGTYGVLKVIAPFVVAFPEEEVQFISLLASSVGNALENAKIHQESRRLIHDLQLINDTSRHLNSNLHLTEIGEYLKGKIKSAIAAEDVLIVLCENGKISDIVNSLSEQIKEKEKLQQLIKDISHFVNETKEAVLYGDIVQEKVFSGLPCRSLLIIPMKQKNEIIGFIAAFHSKPYQFSFDQFKLLQALVYHTTLAFTNAILHQKLERMVETDHLTGLYARKYLDDIIQISLEQDACGSFLLIDIDDFKKVNDTYGHQVGDQVLIQVANILKQHTRKCDVVARWGGEELAIYLPNVKEKDSLIIANRFVQLIPENTNPSVTISCGVSVWTKDEKDSAKKLFLRADDALYTVKKSGKNCAKLAK